MCGIAGYIGSGDAVSHLLEGLRALEYRGYDSAGVAVMDGQRCVHVVKTNLNEDSGLLGGACLVFSKNG